MNCSATFFIRHPDACFTQIQPNEIVVLNAADNDFYHLNESAADLWLTLGEPNTLETLVQKLLDKYDGEVETYEKDVFEWINDMKQKGLIETYPVTDMTSSNI